MPITISGTTGIAGVDGSAGTPAVQGSDTNTGVFYPAANTVAISTNGTEGFRVNSDTQAEFKDGTASLPSIAHSGDLNTGAYFPAADTIGLVTSGSERFRIGSSGQLGIGGATYGASGQVLTSGGASAAPAWSYGLFTNISNLATTSGTNPTISGLDLTNYKILIIVFDGVYHSSTGNTRSIFIGNSTSDDLDITDPFGSSDAGACRGFCFIDLNIGTTFSVTVSSNVNATTSTGQSIFVGDLPITTASTTLSFALSSTGNFAGGTIRVYGL